MAEERTVREGSFPNSWLLKVAGRFSPPKILVKKCQILG